MHPTYFTLNAIQVALPEDELQFRCKIHLPSSRQGRASGGGRHTHTHTDAIRGASRSNRARGNRVETCREFQWIGSDRIGPKLLMPITPLSRLGKTGRANV